MIIQSIINWFGGLLTGFLDLLPALPPEVAAFLDTVPGYVGQLASWITKLSPIVPYEHIGISIGVIISAYLVSITIQASLKIVSLFTGGGGAV